MNPSVAMTPFLRSVAVEYIARHGADLGNVCFVLPGKRACIFLERYISQVVEERYHRLPARAEMPLMITFAEFVEKVTGMRTASRVELMFCLFDAWKSVGGTPDFEHFRSWADMVLRDFDEIDSYDVPALDLFHNIETYNEISTDYLTEQQLRVVSEYFGVERRPMNADTMWRHYNPRTPLAKKFNELWEMLGPLYQAFSALLTAHGAGYPGMLTRSAADLVEAKGRVSLPASRLVLVGFDMLTTAQLRLFSAIRDLRVETGEPIADFFWDSPGTPLSKESVMEAGRFQWLNKELFPCSVEGFDRYTEHITLPGTIDVVSCPGNTAQAKVAGLLLDNVATTLGTTFTDPARVAIVLPDENLLFPMYYAVPESLAADVNLTMGYPLRVTSVSSFVILLRRLYMSMRRVDGSDKFHFKEVRTLLYHPLCQLILGVESVERIQGKILEEHLYYVSVADMLTVFPQGEQARHKELLEVLFAALRKQDNLAQACSRINACLQLALTVYMKGEHKEHARIDVLNLQAYMGAVVEFEQLALRHSLSSMSWRTALSLLDRMLQNYTVHIQGQPLTGLQIMGMLETRCLDFDYLIILSMNERIFPRRLRQHTFIPDTLRAAWMLPTQSRKEQAYAYHFYRLIARARQVHLLYDASQGGRKSGDPSRYLLQLRHFFDSNLRWRSARFGISTPPAADFTAPKHIDDLKPYLTQDSGISLSASNLKDYLACPFKFYLAHVLHKKLYKEPEEYMDAATQGTILHDTMQTLYDSLLPPGYDTDKDGPYVRLITKDIISGWLKGETMSVREVVERLVREKYPAARNMETLHGDADIMADVIERYARYCLQADMQIAPFEYIDNEHKIRVQLPLGDGRQANFTFIIDRLDALIMPDGSRRLRIVDYKTGSDKTSFKKVTDLFHPSSAAGNTKGIFQLMLYSLLYPLHDSKVSAQTPIALSIYATRRLEVTDFESMVQYCGMPVLSHLPLLEEYREQLMVELHDLFDLDKPFTQTPDLSHCTYCDFRQLCSR